MARQIRKPRNIDYAQSARLQSRLIEMGISWPTGWEVYVVDANRGHARASSKTCTVPKWATIKDVKGKVSNDYEVYYAAHEIAHAWNLQVYGNVVDHNDTFYEFFKKHCPPNLWHYELNYKTREPKKAGISDDPKVNEARKHGFEEIRNDFPVAQAAGPTLDVSELRDAAIKIDPRLRSRLANMADHEVRSYVTGWFKLGGA